MNPSITNANKMWLYRAIIPRNLHQLKTCVQCSSLVLQLLTCLKQMSSMECASQWSSENKVCVNRWFIYHLYIKMYGQQHSMTREYKHEIDPPANKENTMIFFPLANKSMTPLSVCGHQIWYTIWPWTVIGAGSTQKRFMKYPSRWKSIDEFLCWIDLWW